MKSGSVTNESTFSMEVRSGGLAVDLCGSAFDSTEGNETHLHIDGAARDMPKKRGLNTVILHPDGSFKTNASHDIYSNKILWNDWANWVNANAAVGDIVAVASYDAISNAPSSGAAQSLLSAIGATKAFDAIYGVDWKEARAPYALLFTQGNSTCTETSQPHKGPNAHIQINMATVTKAQLPPVVDIAWLQGEQPLLLTAMASGNLNREVLKGEEKDFVSIVEGVHAQAVGQYGNFMYVAFSRLSGSGRLWIYDLKEKIGTNFALPTGHPHPCNIQIVANHMIVAVEAAYGTPQELKIIERDKRSVIVIYDLEPDPRQPVEVTRINQDDTNCGGAGLTFHPASGRWFILADRDSGDDTAGTVLYRSTGESLSSWEPTPVKSYQRFGSGAGINLITATDGSIWGFYFVDTQDDLPDFAAWDMTADKVRLFKVVTPTGIPVNRLSIVSQITNLGSPKVKGAGELFLSSRPGMRFGAGLRNERGKFELLTCQRNMEASFRVDHVSLEAGKSTVMFVNFGGFLAEMYATAADEKKSRHSGHLKITESWEVRMTPPINGNINHQNGLKWSDEWDGALTAPTNLCTIWGTASLAKVRSKSFTAVYEDRGNTLSGNETLQPGECLVSADKKFKLTLSFNGTLKLVRLEDSFVLWGRTLNHSECFGIVDPAFGFCIKAGTPEEPLDVLWSTGCPSPVSFLKMLDDGNLCQYQGTTSAQGDYMWGSFQSRGAKPSKLHLKISGVKFTCTFSDDEGPGNDADMDRLKLSAQLDKETEHNVVNWATKGEWTVQRGSSKDFNEQLSLTLNGDPVGRTLTLGGFTREYDTTSANEHGWGNMVIKGDDLWSLADCHKNGFGPQLCAFDVNSSDAGFRISFTVECLM